MAKQPKKPDPSLAIDCPGCGAKAGARCVKAVCPERKLAERQRHDCARCGARAGFPCVDFKGRPLSEDAWREPACAERGRPEVAAKKLARKADEVNARTLKQYGGDNTLLTYLYGGADGLLAAEGVAKVTPEKLAAERLRAERYKENSGHAEHCLRTGLNWITIHFMRRVAAERIGADWEAKLWERSSGTFGSNYEYILDRYRKCLCTSEREELAWEARRETCAVSEYNPRGERVKIVPTHVWNAEGNPPVMTREEFNALFALKSIFWTAPTDLPEHDDGGLFDRTIGVLNGAAA